MQSYAQFGQLNKCVYFVQTNGAPKKQTQCASAYMSTYTFTFKKNTFLQKKAFSYIWVCYRENSKWIVMQLHRFIDIYRIEMWISLRAYIYEFPIKAIKQQDTEMYIKRTACFCVFWLVLFMFDVKEVASLYLPFCRLSRFSTYHFVFNPFNVDIQYRMLGEYLHNLKHSIHFPLYIYIYLVFLLIYAFPPVLVCCRMCCIMRFV